MLSLLHSEILRDVLLHSVLLPAVTAAVILGGVLFAGRARAAAFGTALAFAGGFALAAFPDVLPLKPGIAAWHWLPTAALAALAAGVLARPLPLGARPGGCCNGKKPQAWPPGCSSHLLWKRRSGGPGRPCAWSFWRNGTSSNDSPGPPLADRRRWPWL